MKIAYLGTGSWGFCLAMLLAGKGYDVVSWASKEELVNTIRDTQRHPRFPHVECLPNLKVTSHLAEAVDGADIIIESVTAAGIRSVCEKLKQLNIDPRIFVLTSKGIEQNTALVLPDVIVEVLGEEFYPYVGCLSGPSYAQEVIQGLPTSVVASAHHYDTMMAICKLFTTPTFRVYPNTDFKGISYCGAMKNVIAIACGIAEGLKFGFSARAALMTRGLHEIKKMALACGGQRETINGLAGMGDLCLTCSSTMSRNFLFGSYLAEGMSTIDAFNKVGMVVEGAYTSVTALQISRELEIPMPITETVHQILHEGLKPEDAVAILMQREVKEEHL